MRLLSIALSCLFAFISSFSMYCQVVGNGITLTNESISADSLEFNNIIIGDTAFFEIQITNTVGVTQEISVSGLTTPFEISDSAITILPNESEFIILSFHPIDEGYYSNHLIFSGSVFGSAAIWITGFASPRYGCTDTTACNYDNLATIDNGVCIYGNWCDTCSGETDGTGVVINNDIDGDGICDFDEVIGCT